MSQLYVIITVTRPTRFLIGNKKILTTWPRVFGVSTRRRFTWKHFIRKCHFHSVDIGGFGGWGSPPPPPIESGVPIYAPSPSSEPPYLGYWLPLAITKTPPFQLVLSLQIPPPPGQKWRPFCELLFYYIFNFFACQIVPPGSNNLQRCKQDLVNTLAGKKRTMVFQFAMIYVDFWHFESKRHTRGYIEMVVMVFFIISCLFVFFFLLVSLFRREVTIFKDINKTE